MAGRGRASLSAKRSDGRGGSSTTGRRAAPAFAKPLLYTAQDVARFCEVDLKTIHHWADGGKIPHHRTEGRHLRFRRNHVLAFLRRHGYPVHDEIATARPTVFYAVPPPADAAAGAPDGEEIARKLSQRFFVRRFDTALAAIAHLVAGEPDALVVSLDDATWAGARAVCTLKADAATSWPLLVVVDDASGESATISEVKEAGADIVIRPADLVRLHVELTRALGLA